MVTTHIHTTLQDTQASPHYRYNSLCNSVRPKPQKLKVSGQRREGGVTLLPDPALPLHLNKVTDS